MTMEQEFKLKQIETLLPNASKDDIITVFIALQEQCFVLSNNVVQLVKTWPIHPSITETTGKSETSS